MGAQVARGRLDQGPAGAAQTVSGSTPCELSGHLGLRSMHKPRSGPAARCKFQRSRPGNPSRGHSSIRAAESFQQ